MTEKLLHQISDHVYWMKPDVPDRPSLCTVVGRSITVMLDSGASDAHARLFLAALAAEGIAAPRYVVLTHWHWDHVFGAAAVEAAVIAHADTAAQLEVLSGYDWQDAALDARVSTGEEIAFCADNIKIELPAPRQITIRQPAIIFHDTLELRVGGAKCHLEHVGGDHAADACVIHIAPDNVLFLGDCLYDAIYAPVRHYTTQKLFPLLDRVLNFDALAYVEGHSDTIMTRAEMALMAENMRLAGTLVEQIGTDEVAVLSALAAKIGQPPDEDMTDFVRAFIAGRKV